MAAAARTAVRTWRFSATPENLDQLLAEEKEDPESRINVLFDENEQQGSDEAERETEFPQGGELDARRGARESIQRWRAFDL